MSTKQIIFRISMIILIVEALIMESLNILDLNLTSMEKSFIDGLFLVGLSTPFIYMLVIKPFIMMKDKALSEVSYLAYHDKTTNLPNRTKLLELLDYSINTSQKDDNISVMILELGRLKAINDTFGHITVDDVIIKISDRLKSITSNIPLLAKVNPNSFAFLIEHTDSNDEVYTLARDVINSVIKPINYNGHSFILDAFIGISNYPKDAKDSENLLKFAHIAARQAKTNENDKISFYTQSLTDLVHNHFTLEVDLRNAIENREFHLLYQPKIDAKTNILVGVEALLRWEHPEKGLINPLDFIPLAEDTGLIIPLGEWIIHEALQQQKAWIDEGRKPITMSINLSGKQLRPDYIIDIIQELNNNRISMEYIELEITETSIINNPTQAQLLLEVLHNKGISIAMDDFGTGYSSFAYLKRFKIDTLKIDRELIKDIEKNKNDFTIAKAIVVMAHTLEMKVVAEGVETKEQADMLKEMGCDYLQGYYFSKPVDANSVYLGKNYMTEDTV